MQEELMKKDNNDKRILKENERMRGKEGMEY